MSVKKIFIVIVTFILLSCCDKYANIANKEIIGEYHSSGNMNDASTSIALYSNQFFALKIYSFDDIKELKDRIFYGKYYLIGEMGIKFIVNGYYSVNDGIVKYENGYEYLNPSFLKKNVSEEYSWYDGFNESVGIKLVKELSNNLYNHFFYLVDTSIKSKSNNQYLVKYTYDQFISNQNLWIKMYLED
jgi:hypothetical protein